MRERMDAPTPDNVQLQVTFPKTHVKEMQLMVSEGDFMYVQDVVRTAVRELIEKRNLQKSMGLRSANKRDGWGGV